MKMYTSLDYIKIDIANNFGNDKLKFEERIDWFNENQNNLENLVKQSENPAQFAAGIDAYKKALKGEPTGYLISLDATASGMQILSALIGDVKTSRLVNLINLERRIDPYTNLFNKFKENNNICTFDREHIKKAVMTAFYGSNATPKEIFGDKLDLFYALLQQECPGAWELNKFMLDSWDPTAHEYCWTLPDGFQVRKEVMNTVNKLFNDGETVVEFSYKEQGSSPYGKCLCADMVHSIDSFILRELTMRASIGTRKEKIKRILNSKNIYLNKDSTNREIVKRLLELYKSTGILSSRILLHINENNIDLVLPYKEVLLNLLNKYPNKAFKIIGIHDCFKVLPNYGNTLRIMYIELMREIAKSNLASHIISEMLRKKVVINKISNNLHELIDGEYAIC